MTAFHQSAIKINEVIDCHIERVNQSLFQRKTLHLQWIIRGRPIGVSVENVTETMETESGNHVKVKLRVISCDVSK